MIDIKIRKKETLMPLKIIKTLLKPPFLNSPNGMGLAFSPTELMRRQHLQRLGFFFMLMILSFAGFAGASESSFQLPSSEEEIQKFLKSPNLPLEELQKISDADLMELISKAPQLKLHPLIFAAFKDDTMVLFAYRKNPPLQFDLKNEVPEAAWKRLENLWTDYAAMILGGLGSLDGCFQVMKNLGGTDK